MEEKANYELLFNMCMESYAKAATHLHNLAITLHQDAELVKRLPCETSAFFGPYDQASGRLSAISEILRKFNVQMKLSDLPIHSSSTPTPQLDALKAYKDLKVDTGPVFNFNKIKINSEYFLVGHEGEAMITHVKDAKQNLFYFVDILRFECRLINELASYSNRNEELQKTLPPSGCIFGLLVDGSVSRAVREVVVNPNSPTVNAFLIDIGEIINVAIDVFHWYHLPRDLQQVAPQAIACKLHKMHGFNGYDAQRFYNEIEGATLKYKVISTDRNLLCVDIYAADVVTTVQSNASPPNHSTVHHPSNPFAADMLNDNVEAEATTKPTASVQLTEEERKELFADTGCTQNAMIAVMGYNPQDDKRICKFYDPKTGGCFKGGKCRLEHVAKLPDGWTRDQMLSKIQTRVEMPLIAIESQIQIITTHVVSPKMFYAQLVKFDSKLLEINLKINEPEFASKYQQLRQIPGVMELVLARYSDGNMYRAQVAEIIEDRVMVYYVDFGNSELVDLADLYNWDDRFDFLPFQAYPMSLDTTTDKWLEETRTVERFKRLVLNKKITAHIKFRLDGKHLVRLIGNDGFDIMDVLQSYVLSDYKPSQEELCAS